jgi:hypothetical protein
VEKLDLPPDAPAPSGAVAADHLVLPLAGLFGVELGRRHALLDANSMLFLHRNTEFKETRPLPGTGHASAAITPAPEVLEELCFRRGRRTSRPANGSTRSVAMLPRMLAHRLVALHGQQERAIEADELAWQILEEALTADASERSVEPRVVAKAKHLLHAELFEPRTNWVCRRSISPRSSSSRKDCRSTNIKPACG